MKSLRNTEEYGGATHAGEYPQSGLGQHPARQEKPMHRWLRKIDGLAELYRLLQQIEQTRIQQQHCARAVDQLLSERDLALYECYRMFRRNGGVTVGDFDDFLRRYFGCCVKDEPVPKRGSLRLVVSDREKSASKPAHGPKAA
jgi:hypothetical protein